MPDILIVNASPLIFLGNAGRIDLLRTTGADRVIVPEPVFDEVISGGYTDKAARAISEAEWIEKRPSPPIPESVIAWDLGAGESWSSRWPFRCPARMSSSTT
jgi:predicted nucleic acid-binding protein